MKWVMLLVLAVGFSGSVVADESEELKPNCKLTVQTFLKSGKKKLQVDEIFAPTRKICQSEAQIRRIVSEEDSEDIDNIKVTFGFKEAN